MDTPFASVTYYCADQNPHRDRSRGITNFTVALLKHLYETGQLRMEVVASRSSYAMLGEIPHRSLPFRTDHFPGRLAADHLHPFLVAGARRTDPTRIWHYPKGFLPFGAQVRAPRVGTLHDVILQFYADHYPRSRSALNFRYWLGLLKRSIPRFDLILTVSENSRAAILEFCERHAIKCPQIVVTFQGSDVSDLAPAAVANRPKEDYVLHLASRLPHKGTVWLLQQWRRLEETSGTDLPPLRLVGEVDVEARRQLAGLRTARWESSLPRGEMLAVLAGARALLLPSRVEGFGLPALEAYAVGTPVAYVRDTAVEEVLGSGCPGAFEMGETAGAESLRAALVEVLALNPAEMARIHSDLSTRFSWKGCVDKTLDAYRRLLP